MSILMVLAGLVIGALVLIALYLHWQLFKRSQRAKQAQKQMSEQVAQQNDSWRRSIRVIAQAYVAGQVETAEACLRLSKLMDLLEWEEGRREPFLVIDKMAQSLAHIPILTEWKALPRVERRKYEAYIHSQEASLEAFIRPAMEQLKAL